jgi:hypothetical protein
VIQRATIRMMAVGPSWEAVSRMQGRRALTRLEAKHGDALDVNMAKLSRLAHRISEEEGDDA